MRSLDREFRDMVADKAAGLLRRAAGRAPQPDRDFWALRDVSFDVPRSKVLGVIGTNGAGKSTLLKVLSRITDPTHGHADLRGRVGSLLEVGTGFHPELSGRENIFLSGVTLGMRRKEVAAKFDEIVAFSEIEQFLDTPVKRYSSGMYVRLAFAVAAHLEPEILLIDEVLAVGDAGFQRKCLGKMNDVADQGRTILFVSHNMGAVTNLCDQVLLLHKGQAKCLTDAKSAVAQYLELTSNWRNEVQAHFQGNLKNEVLIQDLRINDLAPDDPNLLSPHEPFTLTARGTARSTVSNFRITFSIFRDGVRLLTQHDLPHPQTLPAGEFEATVTIPARLLRPGSYSIGVGGHRDGREEWVWGSDLATFTILEEWDDQLDPEDLGWVHAPHQGQRLVYGKGIAA